MRDLADLHGFSIGAAVHTGAFVSGEVPYRDTLKNEFNILVAENMMKFSDIYPSPDGYNWAPTDALIEFAEANTMKVRGHTLAWHQQITSWVTRRQWTRAQVLELLEQHIRSVVGRYRGRVWAWDVVNEAITDEGGYRTDSFWYRHLGPEYIELAFRWAHAADPDAILYYNDYGAEDLCPKSDSVYHLVRDLKNADVPIHGVGWQMHVTEDWQLSADHHRNAERLRALGLELSITEMDVRLRTPTSAAQLEAQAAIYAQVLKFALSTCVALLAWGFTDKYSWIPSWRHEYGDALLFDADYQPKPAYAAMRAVLEGGDQV